MKFSTRHAAIALGAIVLLGAGAGTALAQDDPPPTTSDPTSDRGRGAFVCANLEQIQQLQTDRAALIEDRLLLLQSARTEAEANGNAKVVERIDRRTERAAERQGNVAERQAKLVAFAAENCAD